MEEKLLTPKEVAERLGVSLETVGSYLRAGKLPGQKVGALWRTRERDLNEYIAAGSEAAAAKRAAQAKGEKS